MATSAVWDLRKLQLHLDKKDPEPLYLLYGEEVFLQDQALRAIKDKVLSEGAVDFNFDSFIAPETGPGHVLDTVETLPMMCPRRLVIYKNVDVLKDELWEQLLPTIENPLDT